MCAHVPVRRACRAAFTLIELLVVVAIVALLVAVLVPSLGAARRQGKVVVCLNRMRQLGQFTTYFSGDHRDEMPRSMHSAFAHRAMPWGYAFYVYLTGRSFTEEDKSWTAMFNRNYRCPLDPRREKTAWSYGYNVYYELTETETRGRTWRRAMEIPRPSETVLFGEVGNTSSHAMADHVMAHFWVQFDAPAEVAKERHEPHAGYVFLDGHARNLSFDRTFDRELHRDKWNPAAAD